MNVISMFVRRQHNPYHPFDAESKSLDVRGQRRRLLNFETSVEAHYGMSDHTRRPSYQR
jgi:hypothetical protein